MKKNMGIIDRTARILIAVIFGILYFTNAITGTWGIVMLAVAVLFIVTGILGICPGYIPFKLNTGAKKV